MKPCKVVVTDEAYWGPAGKIPRRLHPGQKLTFIPKPGEEELPSWCIPAEKAQKPKDPEEVDFDAEEDLEEEPIEEEEEEADTLHEVQKRQNIVEALNELDHDNDDHWTKDGKPSMEAVEGIVGDKSITRADVEAARPGFKRAESEEEEI